MNVVKLNDGYDLERLRELYEESPNERTALRLRAIYLRAKGKTPPEIARILGFHTNTVRSWIKQFNQGGPARLEYRHSGGRSSKLLKEQEESLAQWFEEESPGGERYTLKQLAQRLFEEYGVRISQQQLSQRISRLGLRRGRGNQGGRAAGSKPRKRGRGAKRQP